jgi:hypothetical protein
MSIQPKFAMKRMPIILLVSLLTAGSFAQVQSNKPQIAPTYSSSIGTNKLTLRQKIQALNLTRDQKIQVRQILQNAKANKETINANDSLLQDQKQLQLKELRRQIFANFNAILTDEQKEKWKAMRADTNKNDQQENQLCKMRSIHFR